MLTTIRMDVQQVTEDLSSLLDDVGNRICLAAAEAGGEVVLNTYRAEMHRRETVSGTYKSAQGAIEHFINAFESVAKRTLLFRDRQGAYSLVGIATEAGNWRMASPQALWVEEGTADREREDGRRTGKVTAEHILAGIVEQTSDIVIATMQNVIIEELEKYAN